jgi:pyridinium-3,5-bisthiocarboxylic acid mononucleotide nickel chelatase
VIAYVDSFAGLAGDMFVAALLDAGLELSALQEALEGLALEGFAVEAEAVQRGGMAGTQFHVRVTQEQHVHRHLSDIVAILDESTLSKSVTKNAKAVFHRLAEAEAQAHGCPIEQVHFHEVGAIDSIVDIVAACIGLELLDISEIQASPIPLGSGTVKCAHGIMPVPAPATAHLVRGFDVYAGPNSGEATTPTGAALVTALAQSQGALPAMQISEMGYGAGSRDDGAVPNLLRIVLGTSSADGEADAMLELSANVDDTTGEILGATIEALLDSGCVDAWATPATMKKSRPGWVLSCLCDVNRAPAIRDIFFGQCGTLGVRERSVSRRKLLRRFDTVQTEYGAVRIKVGLRGKTPVSHKCEFADCAAAAASHHVSPREVQLAALGAWREGGQR